MSKLKEQCLDNENKTNLVKKLKSNPDVSQELIKDFKEITAYQNNIIKNLDEVISKYEGDSAELENLEKTLFQFKKQEEIAKKLQSSIFPEVLPDNDIVTISAKLFSMDETSGDFYDVIEIIPDSVYAVLLADISGHGVSAALITNLAKMLFVRASKKYTSPKDVMAYVNTEICNILHQRSYFTAFYILIDFPNKQVVYTSAGHPYNMRYNAKTEEVEKLYTKDMVIGVIKGREFKEKAINFNVGDRIILYTDGISEARNSEKEMFGDERLSNIIKEHSKTPAKELIEMIEYEIKTFTGRNDFDDDVTLVVIDIKSDKAKSKDTGSGRRDLNDEERNRLIDYYQKSIKIKEKHKDNEGMVDDLRKLANLLVTKGKNDEALELYKKAEKLAKEIKSEKLLGETNISLCNFYHQAGDVDKAFDCVEKSIENFNSINDREGLTKSYNNKSILYSRKGNNKKAKEFLFKSLEVLKSLKPTEDIMHSISLCYNNLGVNYANEQDWDNTIKYFEKSLELADQYDFKRLQATLMNNIANSYMVKTENEIALKYLNKSLLLASEISFKELLGTVLTNIGGLYFEWGDYELGFYYYAKAIKVCKKYGFPYKEAFTKIQRAYQFIKVGKVKEFILDMNDSFNLIEKLKRDPTDGYIYVNVGIFFYKVDIRKLRLEDDFIEHYEMFKKYTENKSDPDYFFQKALKESSRQKRSEVYIFVSYEYAIYLHKLGKVDEAVKRLKEALNLAKEYKDINERKKVEKVIKKLGLEDKVFDL